MATNEGNTALRRNKNTPLEAHQADDFPEGLNYMKMPFFRPKNNRKKGLLYGDTRGRSWKNGDDLDYLETLD